MNERVDGQNSGQQGLGEQNEILQSDEPEFFFLNNAYLNAYIQLLKSIRHHGGLFLLTGAHGLGKTFLLRKLESATPENVKFISIDAAGLNYESLIARLCDQLGMGQTERHLTGQNQGPVLKDYLNDGSSQRASVALLIDDAQTLGEAGLAHLIALFDWTLPERRAPRIVLSGSPELQEMVARIEIGQGIAARRLNVRLEPLAENDVATYISHQLNTVTTPEMNPLFSRWAIQKITRLTGGVPRLIDALCARAFSLTQSKGKHTVSTLVIDQAAKELRLEVEESSASGLTLVPGYTHPLHDPARHPERSRFTKIDSHVIGDEADAIIMSASLASHNKPAPELDETVNEAVLQNTSEYPVTAVHFAKSDPEALHEVTHPVTPTALSVSRNTDVARHQFVDQMLEDKLLANATMTMQWEEPYLKKSQPPPFSSPTLQFVTLIFISILAGIVGGVGSYYLFDSKPVQISVVTPGAVAAAVESKAPAQTAPALKPVAAPDPAASAAPAGAEPRGTGPLAAKPVVEKAGVALTSPPSAVELAPATPARLPSRVKAIAETPQLLSYVSKGDALLAQGDVASARLFYLEAAGAGFAPAMTAVGKTYDPIVLGGLQIKGFFADPKKAVEWYLKAQKAGSTESSGYLQALRQSLAGSSALETTGVKELPQ